MHVQTAPLSFSFVLSLSFLPTFLPSYPLLLVLHLGGLAVFRRSLCEHGPYSLGAVDAAANLSGRAKDQH